MRSVFARVGTTIAALILGSGLLATSAMAGKAESFTGEVGDSMCGLKHEMGGSPAECTRECIKEGSKYALIVGDKVYTLETKDKAALDQLDKLAGAKAKVTGALDGTTIAVQSVAAAK